MKGISRKENNNNNNKEKTKEKRQNQTKIKENKQTKNNLKNPFGGGVEVEKVNKEIMLL